MTQAAMAYLLLIEAEPPNREELCRMLSREPCEEPDSNQKGMAVLRGLPTHPQATVVILTGYGSEEVEMVAQTLGVKPALRRRVRLHELTSAISAMLGGRSRQGE